MDSLAGYRDSDGSENSPKHHPMRTKSKPSAGVEKPPELMAEWETFQKMLGSNAFDGSISPEVKEKDSDEEAELVKPKASRSRSSSASSASSKSRSSHSSRSSSASSRSPSPKKSATTSKKSRSKSPKEASHRKTPQRIRSSGSEERHNEAAPIVVPDSSTEAPEHTGRKKSRSRSRSRAKRSRSRERRRRRRRSRSRGRRSRSRDRKEGKSRSSPGRRKRSHSRERRSRSKGRRRSRSHSRSRRSTSRSKVRRRKSRSGSRGKSRRQHSRSRSRERRRDRSRDRRRHGRRRKRRHSRSRRRHSKSRSRSPTRKQNAPLSFKEKLKQSLMEVQKQATAGTLNMDDFTNSNLVGKEKPSILPLNAANPLMALAMGSGQVTPQQALLQTMAAMHQKAQELTGVAVPKYYNPAAVNPLKYAEQVQKRKLLWGKKDKSEDDASTSSAGTIATATSPTTVPAASSSAAAAAAAAGTPWTGTSFNQDKDGKMTAKFRKLMGMKEVEVEANETQKQGEDQMKKQEEIFQRLDQEYEFARMATHTHRGIGLGFTSLYGQFK